MGCVNTNQEKNNSKPFYSKSTAVLDTDTDVDTFDDDEKEEYYTALNTKMDKIMHKLLWLKQRAQSYEDKKSVNKINWIIKTLHDKDLNEPLRHEENMSPESLEIIAMYSQQCNIQAQISDNITVKKVEKLKVIRRSEKYQKFINKFKKNLKKHVSDVENQHNKLWGDIPKNIQEEVRKEIHKVDRYDFDVYAMDSLLKKKTLPYILTHILTQFNFINDLLKEKNYYNFINEIADGYNRNVVYHNDLHAADVLQTTYILITIGNLTRKLKLTDIDVMSTLIAAACHDFKHNGFTNTYHTNIFSDISVNYNDVSVLESFHVCETFKLIFKDGFNPFEKLSPEQFRTIRRRMIECILATDMVHHSTHYNELKSKLESLGITNGKNVDNLILKGESNEAAVKNNEVQQMVLSACIHTSDIGAPAKTTKVCDKMLELVYIEFFNQGDKEKAYGLPVSMLCDRVTTNIYRSQVFFIKIIVNPQFLIVSHIVPETGKYLENIQQNLKYYEEKVARDEKLEIPVLKD